MATAKDILNLFPDFSKLSKPSIYTALQPTTPAPLANILGESVTGAYKTLLSQLGLTKTAAPAQQQTTPAPTTPAGVDKVVKAGSQPGGGGVTTAIKTGAGLAPAATGQVATAQGEDPYAKAMEATQAQIPLIQQRYQALLDEISRSTAEGQQAQEQATTSSIGEARARSAAQGVYGGTTELGTETNIRNQAASAIRNIQETGASQKAQATAQEAVDIGQVTKDLANLAISKNKADQDAYQYAMDYILKKQQLSIQSAQLGKGTVVQTAEGVNLVNPYTGQTIARLGSPKTTASGKDILTANLGKDVVNQINQSPVLKNTGTADALKVYAKLQVPAGLGQIGMTAQEAQYKQLQGYFFSLQQAAIKAIQGTRPSDYDAISYAKNVGLSITQSPEANAVAINQLLNLVGGGTISPSVTDTGTDTTSVWF